MLCYSCAEQGVQEPAVALCRACNAGLCMNHLQETASDFASDAMLAHCRHDTWTVGARVAAGPGNDNGNTDGNASEQSAEIDLIGPGLMGADGPRTGNEIH